MADLASREPLAQPAPAAAAMTLRGSAEAAMEPQGTLVTCREL